MNEVIFYEIEKEKWCEVRYLDAVISYLNKKITNYSIIVTPNQHTLPNTKFAKIIVILTGDELGFFSSQNYNNPNIVKIFRFFNRIGRYDEKFIYPIPPGYNWTMHNDYSKQMIKMYPEKKLSERKYDISFLGQPLPCRIELFNILNQLSSKYNVLSSVSPSFRTGVHIDDYYKIMGDTKIALAPDGTSVDTFRYVEAFGSGCVVITTKKDDIWYYRNSPTVFINSWSELNDKLIENILSMDLEELYDKNLKYYKEILSEEAVANYIYINLI
jgi:hypothetical protein